MCVLIVRRKFGLNCKMFFFSIKTKTKNKDKHIIFFNTRNRNSLKVLRIDYRIGHWRTTDYLMFPMIGGPLFLVLFINICQNTFSFKYSLLIAQFWNTSIKICTQWKMSACTKFVLKSFMTARLRLLLLVAMDGYIKLSTN